MTVRAFALLGLGASGKEFRDRAFTLPGGQLSWIRWLDRDWESGASRPTIFVDLPASDDPGSLPAEMSQEWLDLSPEAGRFVFQIQDPAPWDDHHEAAAAAADVAAGLLAFAAPLDLELRAIELAPEWVEREHVVLQELAEREDDGWQPLELRSELGQAITLRSALVAEIVARIGPALADGDPRRHGVVPALSYYQLAIREFAFAPDDIREIVLAPNARPETPFHRARAEESFHNTWKAIEAVLGGQPPKDGDRLAARLRERGLDPNLDPRFPDGHGRSLAERIDRLHRVRDQQSAHAGRTAAERRVVTYVDLIEAQWIAAEVVHGVLDAAVAAEAHETGT